MSKDKLIQILEFEFLGFLRLSELTDEQIDERLNQAADNILAVTQLNSSPKAQSKSNNKEA